jgi:hypothetical protein
MVEAVEILFGLAPQGNSGESSFDLAAKDRREKFSFDLAAAHRRMVLWRLDGGFGTDPNLLWLAEHNYHFHAKGFAGRRAAKLAQQVQRWIPSGDAWIGSVASPVDYGRPVSVWVKRRLEKDGFQYSYYLTTLKLHSITRAMQLYNQRGRAEVEQFRNDKQGLHLSSRRKQLLVAQQALILLTDLAHNLLADFQQTALAGTPLAGFAAKRIVRDLLNIEGSLVWEAGELKRIDLHQGHPYAAQMVECLKKYCQQG